MSAALVGAFALTWVVVACGSSGNNDLFSGQGNPAGQGGGVGSGGTPFDSSGVGATGGVGGVGGGAGSPKDGAAAGAAGTFGAGEAGPEAGGSGPTKPGGNAVNCGEDTCSLADGERCCVTGGGGFPFPMPAQFSCSSSGNCTIEYRCDGSEDCGGQVCCGVLTATVWERFECRDVCDGDNVSVGCSGPHNCPTGTVCCGTTTPSGIPGINRYVDTQCVTTCELGPNKNILCNSNTQCPNNLTCQQSQVLPAGFRVCR